MFKESLASAATALDILPPSSPLSAIALAQAPRITGCEGTLNTCDAVFNSGND